MSLIASNVARIFLFARRRYIIALHFGRFVFHEKRGRERERERDVTLDIFARIKKAEARSRWCAPPRLSCLRTHTYVHVRGSCNSHISVHADDCSACNKLRSVQRLQARPSPVSHDTSRGSPTYRVSFRYLSFFPPPHPFSQQRIGR